MHTIAIVDDDPITRETLKSYFQDEGFNTLTARDAEQFAVLLQRHRIDLVLLDIRLPGKDGLTVTRELRAQSDVGIILITSRDDHYDRLIGLELGADDYVAKPFEPRELLARSRSLLRRVHRPVGAPPPVMRFQGWELHADKRRLLSPAGEHVRLTTSEFDLLAALAANAGRVLGREELLDMTMRGDETPFDRVVDRTVRRLRRLIEADPADPAIIVTVHGAGYMFAATLE